MYINDLLGGPWKDQQILLADETEVSEANPHGNTEPPSTHTTEATKDTKHA